MQVPLGLVLLFLWAVMTFLFWMVLDLLVDLNDSQNPTTVRRDQRVRRFLTGGVSSSGGIIAFTVMGGLCLTGTVLAVSAELWLQAIGMIASYVGWLLFCTGMANYLKRLQQRVDEKLLKLAQEEEKQNG